MSATRPTGYPEFARSPTNIAEPLTTQKVSGWGIKAPMRRAIDPDEPESKRPFTFDIGPGYDVGEFGNDDKNGDE